MQHTVRDHEIEIDRLRVQLSERRASGRCKVEFSIGWEEAAIAWHMSAKDFAARDEEQKEILL